MESPLALYILFGLGSLFQILAKQLGWGGHSIYIGGTWLSKKITETLGLGAQDLSWSPSGLVNSHSRIRNVLKKKI